MCILSTVLKLGEEEKNFLYSCASLTIDLEKGFSKKPAANASLCRMEPFLPDGGSVKRSFLDDGSFRMECEGNLPELVQSHVLANNGFGYIATDCGAGHMWFQNSRENKMNCWGERPLKRGRPGTGRASCRRGKNVRYLRSRTIRAALRTRRGTRFTKRRSKAFVLKPPSSSRINFPAG